MPVLAKSVLNALFLILVAPLALPLRLLSQITNSDVAFQFGSQLVALFPGIVGDYVRRAYYVLTGCAEWPGPTISFGTIVGQRESRFGPRVYVGAYCSLGAVRIGSDTLLGSGVSVASATAHRFDDANLPISQQGGDLGIVEIGSNCWIGNAAVILADVGDGSVVGAGSVVAKRCDSNGVYVGNPARLVKSRV